MAEEVQGIQIAAVDEVDLLGTGRLWHRISPEVLRNNLREVVAQLYDILPTDDGVERPALRMTQVQVALTIGAKGQVGILGTGAETNVATSLTLTLEPSVADGG